MAVVVAGRKIATTAEHPFYVPDRDWVPAGQLRLGDLVHSHDGQWTPVTAVELTGTPAQVYNFRIADHHTYFVGDDEWGFSVWVHNSTYRGNIEQNAVAGRTREDLEALELQIANPGASVQRERYLRSATGGRLVDPLTGTARRVDIAVIQEDVVLDLVEVTSHSAPKADQIAKENRIRAMGDVFIRDRATKKLRSVNNVPTRLVRRD